MALLVAEAEATAAAVFTTNTLAAAPVLISRERVSRGKARALVVNSGNANACTGELGLTFARQVASCAASLLALAEEDVLLASTGVIGVPLPLPQVLEGVREATSRLSREAGEDFARAIMTTDTRPKLASLEVRGEWGSFRVGGVAKGAGMIEPHLATMLAFLTTDISLDPIQARELLAGVVEETFNRITVDGSTSTNDSVFLLASGRAGTQAKGAAGRALEEALLRVASYLAREIVRDGEGATRIVRVEVVGAADRGEARRACYAVANSPLVKAALYGGDPNWGRVAQAVGAAGVRVDPARLEIWFGAGGVAKPAALKGVAAVPREELEPLLAAREVEIRVALGVGEGSWWVLGTDLSPEYVKLNAAYGT